ncbi:MAG: glycosyltransferase [Candidatus Syntrophosphaera sp.]|nr:glycosyltransferase [Candidatus Syntrophosphaera sp.]
MRILYISYFYPPLGGPAVLRNVKTVKYLARMGIECDVITLRDLEYLYRDASLLGECAEKRIFRTASLDPMALVKRARTGGAKKVSGLYMNTPEHIKLWVRRLYPIDDKIGWNPYLVRAGRKALATADYDFIYVSLGPFSSALGAYKLSRASGIPLVVDLRDYWNLLTDYELQVSALHRRFSRHWEAKIYRHASLIVTATRGIGTDAAAAFGKDLADKMITVYNGWDAGDYQDLPEVEKPDEFTLAYFGNIYARRSLKHFYAAVKRLREENLLPANTRIRLYGNFFRETRAEISTSGIDGMIEIVPQLEHKEALARMQASDVLLLVINSSSPRGTLTSKVFEYLRAGKPILAMVPDHKEAAELLRAHGQDFICAMESAESIYDCLKRLLISGQKEYSIPLELEREKQIEALARRLKSLV